MRTLPGAMALRRGVPNHSFPGCTEEYDAFCIQTRVIVACHLLDELGCEDLVDRLIEDREALENTANCNRDCSYCFAQSVMESVRVNGANMSRDTILDILPNGQVVPCYPLAAVCSAPLPEARDAGWLRSRFQEKLRQYRSIGVFRECGICQLRQAQKCTGGCLAAAMQRLRHVPFVVDLPQNLSEEP